MLGWRLLVIDALDMPVPSHQRAAALRAPLSPTGFAFKGTVATVEIQPFENA
jgi:hypothetical protein